MRKKRILITRPEAQSQKLIDKLSKLNVEIISFPTLEIADVGDKAALNEVIFNLGNFNKVIFLSANAVGKVFAEMGTGVAASIWTGPAAAAPRRARAEALRAAGAPLPLSPVLETFKSGVSKRNLLQ